MKPQSLRESIGAAAKGFLKNAPLFLGVVLLSGLFETVASEELFEKLFGSNALVDSLTGTVIGGVSVGQPIISYILGGELLQSGVSLYAVVAFIVAWVTLGVVQLPLELQLFGKRFTLMRNLLSFAAAIAAAFATVSILAWVP